MKRPLTGHIPDVFCLTLLDINRLQAQLLILDLHFRSLTSIVDIAEVLIIYFPIHEICESF